MPIVKLTARNVLTLPAGAGRIDYTDSETPGFVLRVSESGARTYGVRYGREGTRYTLGDARRLTLADARDLAKKILGRVALGENPAGQKAEARRVEAAGADTLQALGERLLSEAEIGEGTRYKWRSVLRVNIAPDLGDRDPATVTRGEVRELLASVAERAPSQANETLSLLRWIYSRACERELLAANPAAGMRKPRKEVPRDRVATHAELRALWNAAEGAGLYGRAVRLLTLTGCRLSEVFEAKWSELDREAEVWRIPAGRTKSARAHVIPLFEALDTEMGALEDATGGAAASPWLIPGRDPARPLLPMSKAWAALLLAAGIEAEPEAEGEAPVAPPREGRKPWTRHPLSAHDLRRTFRNALTAELGVAPHVAEALIGHAPGRLIQTYAPSGVPLAEKRRALEAWARHLARIVEGKAAEKVARIARMPARA